MANKRIIQAIFLVFWIYPMGFSQNGHGKLSGNFQINSQTYKLDSVIGAQSVAEYIRANSYANVRYDYGKITAGLRYEGYLNALLGYDPGYDGQGIPYYFGQYHGDLIDFTVGNFYEQFGSGILLRAWEDNYLGIDNSIGGVRVKINPFKGIRLTGLLGKQRHFFELGPGLIRAIDGEIAVNEMISTWQNRPSRITLGGSFVSKYQRGNDPVYKLPGNVGAWSARIGLSRNLLMFNAEYAYKINDPSFDNGFIYKPGQALIINTSYAISGFGISLTAKRVDNMSFRSDRNESLNRLMINYLPPISTINSYALMTIYPYASQPTGEAGLQGEILYNLEPGTKLGGKYGTQVAFNLSMVNSIERLPINDTITIGTAGTMGYKSGFINIGNELYYRDFNLEVSRKINRKIKSIFLYQFIKYNQMVVEGKGNLVDAQIVVMDITYKIKPKHFIRFELQGLWTQQDKRNWIMALAEYSISPHWFFAILDQYNYGHPELDKRIHYLYVSVGYTQGPHRIHISYGRQREGILCVGGVCRNIPAMNGLSLNISSRF